MSDFFEVFAMAVSVLALLFALFWGLDKLITSSERGACAQQSEVYGHPTKYYGGDRGCIMDINGEKIKIAVS